MKVKLFHYLLANPKKPEGKHINLEVQQKPLGEALIHSTFIFVMILTFLSFSTFYTDDIVEGAFGIAPALLLLDMTLKMKKIFPEEFSPREKYFISLGVAAVGVSIVFFFGWIVVCKSIIEAPCIVPKYLFCIETSVLYFLLAVYEMRSGFLVFGVDIPKGEPKTETTRKGGKMYIKMYFSELLHGDNRHFHWVSNSLYLQKNGI